VYLTEKRIPSTSIRWNIHAYPKWFIKYCRLNMLLIQELVLTFCASNELRIGHSQGHSNVEAEEL